MPPPKPSISAIVESGWRHYNGGRPAQALRCFRRAIRLGDKGPQVRCFLAHSLHAVGRSGEAHALFLRLARRNPSYMPGLLGHASLLRLGGRNREALALLRRTLRRDPHCQQARRAVSDVLRSLALEGRAAEKVPQAKKYWREVLKLNPGHKEALEELKSLNGAGTAPSKAKGPSSQPVGRPRPTRQGAPAAAQPRGTTEAALVAKAADLQNRGRWDEARRLLVGTIKSFPKSLQAHLSLSVVLCHKRDFKGSAAVLKRAKRLNPDSLGDNRERFRALLAMGRFERAFKLGERILDQGGGIHPNRVFWWSWYDRQAHVPILDRLAKSAPSPWAFYYRGLVRGAEDRAPAGPDELAILDRLSEYDPSRYGWMNIRAGQANLIAGRYRRAIEVLRGALRCKPVDWLAHGFLAEVFLCLGRPVEAFAEMARAGRIAPEGERGQVLAWRGELELWRGRYQEAYRLLDAACGLGAVFAFGWRGAATLKQGNRLAALEYLDRAIELYPIDRESYVWRGEAKRELGRLGEAIEDLDEVSDMVWARWNRALARGLLNDEKGMAEDFRSLPETMTDYVGRRIGLGPGGGLGGEAMRRVLDAGLRWSRGCRRDGYSQAVWMV